jgi:hypothetical protein
MAWAVGNYQPGPVGLRPFDFDLLRMGFEALCAAENKDWKCEKCGASGKTPNPPYLCPVCGEPL